MFSKCLLIFLCLCAYCTNLNAENVNKSVSRVANGWLAHIGDIPYQVALKVALSRRKLQYITYCGAVIIAPSKLISAAHCVFTANKKARNHHVEFSSGRIPYYMFKYKFAVAGNLNQVDTYIRADSENHGQWRNIQSAHFPKSYNFPNHDIAIIYTSRPFHFNEYVAPIPVASRHVEYSGTCLVSGFGRMANEIRSTSLICAHMEIISTPECNKLHQRNMISFVCTTTKISDVGKGDSGGPLVCSNTGDPNEGEKGLLVGVVSGHQPHIGSFFTRVSRYKHFIDKNGSNSIQKCSIQVTFTCFVICLIQGAFWLF